MVLGPHTVSYGKNKIKANSDHKIHMHSALNTLGKHHSLQKFVRYWFG